jgi:hypothetical protein
MDVHGPRDVYANPPQTGEGGLDEWTVVFDDSTGVAVVTTSGLFNVLDHAGMVADVVNRERWRPGHPVLFDHRELDFGPAGYEQLRAARDNHLAHEARIGAARSAILMKSTADFGRGRQFQLIVQDSVSADLAVFTDEKAAWRWPLADGPGN